MHSKWKQYGFLFLLLWMSAPVALANVNLCTFICVFWLMNLFFSNIFIISWRVTVKLRYYPRAYVQEFMAAATSFLLRNASKEQLKKGIYYGVSSLIFAPQAICMVSATSSSAYEACFLCLWCLVECIGSHSVSESATWVFGRCMLKFCKLNWSQASQIKTNARIFCICIRHRKLFVFAFLVALLIVTYIYLVMVWVIFTCFRKTECPF